MGELTSYYPAKEGNKMSKNDYRRMSAAEATDHFFAGYDRYQEATHHIQVAKLGWATLVETRNRLMAIAHRGGWVKLDRDDRDAAEGALKDLAAVATDADFERGKGVMLSICEMAGLGITPHKVDQHFGNIRDLNEGLRSQYKDGIPAIAIFAGQIEVDDFARECGISW